MKIFKDFKIVIILCLTLGLAPFFPEPHIWGKLKWVYGGAKGMEFMDWFDILLHGFPFLLLLWLITLKIFKR
ncbi:hypothetical protein [Algibacter mikhailovii]|uniref:RND transporter n=1 Tax=Algibacter mikhailovii TaxID=425498 RepID=A0A918R1Y0_9FLAO|nr:hypothetical protein [Algibacter mikhailovii]GGZ81885.1 hypothetical protein GCM10007028_19430 [Algibacter mikhailovii]